MSSAHACPPPALATENDWGAPFLPPCHRAEQIPSQEQDGQRARRPNSLGSTQRARGQLMRRFPGPHWPVQQTFTEDSEGLTRWLAAGPREGRGEHFPGFSGVWMSKRSKLCPESPSRPPRPERSGPVAKPLGASVPSPLRRIAVPPHGTVAGKGPASCSEHRGCQGLSISVC